MRSPVRMSSMARARGRASGRRKSPPPAAIIPRDTSGKPNSASSMAITISQARTNSVPPASAKPLTAAITGLVRGKRTKPPKPPSSVSMSRPSPEAIAFKSAPAEKARFPAPVRTATHTSGSLSKRCMMSFIAVATAPLTALRAWGRFRVMNAIRSSTS